MSYRRLRVLIFSVETMRDSYYGLMPYRGLHVLPPCPEPQIVRRWLTALRGGNGEWICSSEVELFRCAAVSSVSRLAPVLFSVTAVVSASLMLLAGWSARASIFWYGPGASLAKVLTMLRHSACSGRSCDRGGTSGFRHVRHLLQRRDHIPNAAMAKANSNSEALAAHVVTQDKKIQATRDDIAALQCEVASESADSPE